MIAATKNTPTLAEFKRRIRVGTTLEAQHHKFPKFSGPRTVVRVGASFFCWTNTDNEKPAWTHWPKAKHTTIDGPDTATLMFDDGTKMVTLTIVSEGDGPAYQSRERKPADRNMYPPIEAVNAHDVASSKSRYGHAPWITWANDLGVRFAARATAENLAAAIAATGKRKIVLYSGDGCGMQGSRGMAKIWLANAKAGMLT